MRNLDPNSAPYDPKSRSMKENPYQSAEQEAGYKGDNFVKISGDYLNLIQNEGFMLEFNKRAEAKGSTLISNTVAMPSQFELLRKEFEKKKEALKVQQEQELQNKYTTEAKIEALKKDDVQ